MGSLTSWAFPGTVSQINLSPLSCFCQDILPQLQKNLKKTKKQKNTFTIKQVMYQQPKITFAKCKEEFCELNSSDYNPDPSYQSPYSQGTTQVSTVVRGGLLESNNSEKHLFFGFSRHDLSVPSSQKTR